MMATPPSLWRLATATDTAFTRGSTDEIKVLGFFTSGRCSLEVVKTENLRSVASFLQKAVLCEHFLGFTRFAFVGCFYSFTVRPNLSSLIQIEFLEKVKKNFCSQT